MVAPLLEFKEADEFLDLKPRPTDVLLLLLLFMFPDGVGWYSKKGLDVASYF